ncbi:MAG: hypothetical protein LAQ69_27020 [Acidobacteriia bacterium]|nr:hypothetical protein [Terriglobia bacterium]
MFVRLLLAAVLATTLASAQGKKGGGGGGSGMGGDAMGGAMRMQRPTKIEEFADKLRLSKEQRDEVQPMLAAAYVESAPLRDQMDKGRVAIAGAMIEGKNADDIKKMLDDYTSLAAQMTAIETKAFAKVVGSLKPNQQSKAAPAFEPMAAVLERPARAGGGGRAGGGRGRQ